MSYLPWLLGVSAFFVLLERLRPARREQRVLRPQLGNDLFYLLFNGHAYALVTGSLIGAVALSTREGLARLGWLPEHPVTCIASRTPSSPEIRVTCNRINWSVLPLGVGIQSSSSARTFGEPLKIASCLLQPA